MPVVVETAVAETEAVVLTEDKLEKIQALLKLLQVKKQALNLMALVDEILEHEARNEIIAALTDGHIQAAARFLTNHPDFLEKMNDLFPSMDAAANN